VPDPVEVPAGKPIPATRAVVLAAGVGSRFGGPKLSARLDGRPVLQLVLDALAAAGLTDPIVVVGEPEPAGVDWRGAERVQNPDPTRGLASSLQIGVEAAFGGAPPPDAVLVVLGDQPLLRPDVIRRVLDAPADPARPIVAPRYAGSAARNPVRLEQAARPLVASAEGDRGLAPLLDRDPTQVRWLDVDGDLPDIDTPGDLAAAAATLWAGRVRRNREQVERFREVVDGPDFYASVSAIFRDDPDRTADPVLEALRAHARPTDTWLDIGAGAGRYALPLARAVEHVIALDPSPAMLGALRESAEAHAIANIDAVDGRWPDAARPGGPLDGRLPVDVSLIAHVSYDVEAIEPFVSAMEAATSRTCLAVLMERSPAMLAEAFWPPVHGEARVALPALPAFVDLLAARGRRPDVRLVETSRRRWADREEVRRYVRRQTWVQPGSAKDRRVDELLDAWLVDGPDGLVELSVASPLRIGLVAWDPS